VIDRRKPLSTHAAHTATSFFKSVVLSALIFSATFFVSAVSAADDRAAMMRDISDHWIAAQLPDGTLPYGFDFLTDKSTAPNGDEWANVVRQVLATYAWSLYLDYSRDRRAEQPIRRSLSAIAQRSLPVGKKRVQYWIERTGVLRVPLARWKVENTLNRFGLLYEPAGSGRVVSPNGKYETAVTGATALALLAELTYSGTSRDQQFASLRSAWLDALIALRIPGSGFRRTPATIDEDDYSNGETWFALAVYCDRYRDDRRCRTLADVDETLMSRYSAQPTIEFYHWGAMTAAQRFRTTGAPVFLSFLQSQGERFINRLESPVFASANRCAPMEGVSAALAVLRRAGSAYAPLAARMQSWLSKEAAKLPRLQIQERQNRLALGGEAALNAPRLASVRGAFLQGLYIPTVQIDATAHCMGAMVTIEREGLLKHAAPL
jgi:hypothetical protein